MLTGDLIRYRVRGDNVFPSYISRKNARYYLGICQDLTRLFRDHTGMPRSALEDSLNNLEGEKTNYKIFRGLAKLLSEDAEFLPACEIDYPALRHFVFSLAQKHYPIVTKADLLHETTRDKILAQAAERFNVPPQEMDSLLYGDLTDNLILTEFNTSYAPESLLKRYNLALAQGLLYRAQSMRITLQGDYKTVFRYIKLAHLIHWIRRQDRGLEIILDGPASLFSSTQRYGVRMACFLPGLLLAGDWRMTASIQTYAGAKKFHLTHNCGLTTHYPPDRLFDSQIEEAFHKKFTRKDRVWTIHREDELIDLGDTVFIPDFSFRHPDGRKATLEIIGFWTPEYLEKKLDKIRKAQKKNLILAVNSQLNCSRDDFNGEAIFYRSGIKIQDVINMLEKFGC